MDDQEKIERLALACGVFMGLLSKQRGLGRLPFNDAKEMDWALNLIGPALYGDAWVPVSVPVDAP